MTPLTRPDPPRISRRRVLGTAANGFGLLGLAGLLAEAQAREPSRGEGSTSNPLAVRPVRTMPRARRAIFIFLNGGPSHVDLLDPKARLAADHGKPLPFEKPKLVPRPDRSARRKPRKTQGPACRQDPGHAWERPACEPESNPSPIADRIVQAGTRNPRRHPVHARRPVAEANRPGGAQEEIRAAPIEVNSVRSDTAMGLVI